MRKMSNFICLEPMSIRYTRAPYGGDVQDDNVKLAIIADIHGNLQALEAVLVDVAREAPDELIVNGDMVNRGPNNIAVVEKVMALDATVLLGNHDDLMRKWIERDRDIPTLWFDDDFWQGTAWSAHGLERAGWIDTLKQLPMTYRPAPASAPSVLVSHGSPRHYREGYGKMLSEEDMAEIVQLYPEDILVGSHTHRPFERRWGDHLILNTGAVGTPFNGDPRAQYLILTLKAGVWQHQFKAVPYDKKAAQQAFYELGYLDEGGISAHIFYEELRCARSFLVPFWNWTQKQEKPQDWTSWELFKEAFPERLLEPEMPTTEHVI